MKLSTVLGLAAILFAPAVAFSATDCSKASDGIVSIHNKDSDTGPMDYKTAIAEAYACFRTAHLGLKTNLEVALAKGKAAWGEIGCSFKEGLETITVKSWNTGKVGHDGEATGEETHLVSQGVQCFDSNSTGMFSGIYSSTQFFIDLQRIITDARGERNDGTTTYKILLIIPSTGSQL